MNCKLLVAVILQLALTMGASAFANPDSLDCGPSTTPGATSCGPDLTPQTPATPNFSTPVLNAVGLPVGLPLSTAHPKVVFQINQAADATTILRFVTNYLIAEPTAEVAVVGYGGGIDFMLKGAKDAAGVPYADQVRTLADKGVQFKACNNTLKLRKLGADAVVPQAVVVPGAVNEIIRLQTREGYAYFRH